MILDSILLLLAILAFIRGWQKGLLWAICSLIAVVLGIIIAMKLSGDLSTYLFNQQMLTGKYTMLICFAILFFGTLFLFRMAVKLIESVLDKLFLGWINHLLGATLYTFFVVFIISTFCWLADQVQLLKPEMKQSSISYSYLQNFAPKTIEVITQYLPFGKDMIQKVGEHLAEVSK